MFEVFLSWLNPDREQAGVKYELIRQRLIRVFCCRGCEIPEDLADETINRVIHRIHECSAGYKGDPALYFLGVARKVWLEYVRRRPNVFVTAALPAEGSGREHECLEQCLRDLPADQAVMILNYYSAEPGGHGTIRRQIAREMGIGLNSLRIRVHRIRLRLHDCIIACLRRTGR